MVKSMYNFRIQVVPEKGCTVIVSRTAILDKFSMNFNVSQESR